MSKHYVMVLFVVDPVEHNTIDSDGEAQAIVTAAIKGQTALPHFDVKYAGTQEPRITT